MHNMAIILLLSIMWQETYTDGIRRQCHRYTDSYTTQNKNTVHTASLKQISSFPCIIEAHIVSLALRLTFDTLKTRYMYSNCRSGYGTILSASLGPRPVSAAAVTWVWGRATFLHSN